MKLHSLKFVQGAVSKKDFVQELTHFVFQGGHVRASNGLLTISSPVDFDVECAPKAEPLVRAIAQCSDVVSLSMTPANRLRLQSGPFRAFIECVEMDNLPHQLPDGIDVAVDGQVLVDAMQTLLPFVGDDATRPWSNGMLIRGQSAFATNNICLVEYWLGTDFPFTANIPLPIIREMLRVGEIPSHAQLSSSAITFHYEDGRWMKTMLYSTEWPDLARILNNSGNAQPIPENFFVALEFLKSFTNVQDTVYFDNGRITTSRDEGVGASYAIDGLPPVGVYRRGMLAKLEGAATRIDFSLYPAPLMFYGDRLRGAIIGLLE